MDGAESTQHGGHAKKIVWDHKTQLSEGAIDLHRSCIDQPSDFSQK